MRYYFVGIKGTGMTALAQLLHARGDEVEGSDVADHFATEDVLGREHIHVHRGFAKANLPRAIDRIVYSSAYDPATHTELQEARRRSIPIATYADVLAEIFRSKEGIAVTGSHGKTTTTALVGVILTEAGYDPSVITGTFVPAFNGNARIGNSRWLVVEADEYNNKLALYDPHHVILLNIDYDHPDFFPSRAAYEKVFEDFLARVPKKGTIITNADDAAVRALTKKLSRSVITSGRSQDSIYRIQGGGWKNGGQEFSIQHKGQEITVHASLPGEHIIVDMAAAAALAHEIGISWEDIQRALAKFSGTQRRFEMKGEFHGVPIIDDYAHHPTEITATIAAARERFPDKRLVCVFQPHTYSRTSIFLDAFGQSLTGDVVLLLPIYASAREKDSADVSSAILAKKITTTDKVYVVASVEASVDLLKKLLQTGDVLLLLGAGDTWKIPDLLLQT